MVNPYCTYKDYLKETANKANSKIDKKLNKHIDKCSTAIFTASSSGKYSFNYRLPWYYCFTNNHYLYMGLHNYFKYTMHVKVVLITYKGEIQEIEFSWN